MNPRHEIDEYCADAARRLGLNLDLVVKLGFGARRIADLDDSQAIKLGRWLRHLDGNRRQGDR